MEITRAELKVLRSLRTKKGRRKERAFLGEGVRVLEEALRHDVLPRDVLCTTGELGSRGQDLVEAFRGRSVRVREILAHELEAIADAETPQGVVAVFDTPPLDLPGSGIGLTRVLVCDRVADPGNLGTLFRSALAFGFSQVVLVGDAVEPHAPKVVRSSAGAVFSLRISRATALEACSFLAGRDIPLVVTGVDESAAELASWAPARDGGGGRSRRREYGDRRGACRRRGIQITHRSHRPGGVA